MLFRAQAYLRAGLPPSYPGLIKLASCKVGFTGLTDAGLEYLVKACPNLAHLELNRCEITENGLKALSRDKELPQLTFLDLSSVPGANPAFIEEIS